MKGPRLVLFIGGIAIPMILTSCGQKEKEAEELVRPVRYERVFTTGGARVRTFSGTAQAGVESRLSFKVPGTVERIAVDVGEAVTRGQVLAELDDHDYRLRVQEAEASLAQAQAAERNARSGYERAQGLYETRGASKQDLDGARAAYESASAQVQSIEKRLELARLQVSYTRLQAPFDGAVAAVLVDESENVAGGSPVIDVTSGSEPEVRVAIPGVLIAQVKSGSPATVRFDAIPDEDFDAMVAEVGVASTGFATAFPVTVRLAEASDRVRPGMAAEVAFRFETAGTQECIIVPAVAVAEDREGRFVFVVEPADEGMGTAVRRAVTVGELTSEGLEILDGLQEGELVVTAGVSRIVDGQKVRVL